jgi:hypothetical protein
VTIIGLGTIATGCDVAFGFLFDAHAPSNRTIAAKT